MICSIILTIKTKIYLAINKFRSINRTKFSYKKIKNKIEKIKFIMKD